MPRSVLRVGTRGSALALAQAEQVRQAVSKVITRRNFELVPVNTTADSLTEDPSPRDWRGIYVDALHDALLSGKIDLAVHSAKDVPSELPQGLVLATVPKREDPRDALLTRSGAGLSSLQPGHKIGTSALRRRSQLLALGRGLDVVPMRGPLDARLRRMSDGDADALVVSLAGLKRLGRADRASEVLPINVMLPAPGQGAVIVVCRANDKNMRAALAELEHAGSRAAVEAERSFVASLDADSNVPVSALAEAAGGSVRMRGLVASADGKRVLEDQLEGDDAEKLGIELADRMRAAGAADLLAAFA